MSRRSRTTLSIEVRLPIPGGSNTALVLDQLRHAIKSYRGDLPNRPAPALDTNELIVKLLRKETTYF